MKDFNTALHRLSERIITTQLLTEIHMSSAALDQILDELDVARQRATYGAVAAVVGASPRTLMSGRERGPRHSWVVNLRSGLPTDYADELIHPQLTTSDTIIKTKDDLIAWLAARGVHVLAGPAAA